MGRLNVNLLGIEMDNPIIPASGTFGYGYEFAEIYDINCLGTFSFKGTTKDPRSGNPLPRIAETPGGMLNSVGLQNPGVEKVISEELPKLKEVFHKPVMANICGFAEEEYIYTCEKLDKEQQVGWLELNVSCPNVHGGGLAFGADGDRCAALVKEIKKVTEKPLIVKLSPNVTDIVDIAKKCEAAGADGLSLINTLLGMRIDLRTRKPVMANVTGGMSGPAVFPVAVRMVYQAAQAVSIPIIGMGGIATAEDALEFIMAGATGVAVGAMNFIDRETTIKVVDGITAFMESNGVTDIKELIGCVR